MQALEEARGLGLVRSLGASNVNPAQLARIEEGGRVDYCQIGYSLLWRRPEEGIVPYCRERGIRIVTYSSLAQGLLAGRFRSLADVPETDSRRRYLVFFRTEVHSAVEECLQSFYRLADEAAVPPVQLALAWNLSRPWADTVLFGARNRRQVEAALPAMEIDLGEELQNRLAGLSRSLLAAILRALPDEENIFGHTPQ
jgi:aryl-alcohol dehydrogenase-like predicted oxidoreductase